LITWFATPIYAESLWSLADNAATEQVYSTSLIPREMSTRQAIAISSAVIEGLALGAELSLEIAPNQVFNYRLSSQQTYLNGDQGWQAEFSDGDQSFAAIITRSSHLLLATIYSPLGKFYLKADSLDSAEVSYVGWLYSQADSGPMLPIDDGGVIGSNYSSNGYGELVLALSGGDVSIEQSLSKEIIKVGDEVDISIAVTNNLSTALVNEMLTVFFALDNAELVSSSGCTLVSIPVIGGAQNTLQCTLGTIDPGASHTVNYTLRSSEQSYPHIASGVFVGDVFGENVRNDEFIVVSKNVLLDSDNDGISDFNEEILNTDPQDSESVVSESFVPEVDLMFLYTQRYLDGIGDSPPETEINQLLQVTNAIYANSGANISFRPVYYGFTEFEVNGNLNAAMNALNAGSDAALATVPNTFSRLGADIVVLIDGFSPGGNLCGLGTVPGVGFDGELRHPVFGGVGVFVSMYMPGFPSGGGSGCDEITLAHELGHNFGLSHSRKQPDRKGTFPWSLGHGIEGSFATVMADPSDYPGSTEIPLFSNPQINDCSGLPCGVSRNDLEQGADAVHSLTQTRFQIADIGSSNVLGTASLSGDSNNAILFGGASKSSDVNRFVNSFASQDSIDVRVTLAIPSEQ
jgi:hypothetical protein